MARNEKHLKVIKDICSKIESSADCKQEIVELSSLIHGSDFYEYHSFIILLEILSIKTDLPSVNKRAVFELLGIIVTKKSNIKDSLLSRLYKFLSSVIRSDLAADFIPICNFVNHQKISKNELYFYITEELLMLSLNSSHRNKMYKNYLSFFKQWTANDLLLLKSFSRVIFNLRSHSKEKEAFELIESVLLIAIEKKHFHTTDDVYKELLGIFKAIMKFENDKKSVKIILKLVNSYDSISNDPVQKSCNSIISKVLNDCSNSKITEETIRSLYLKDYHSPKDIKENDLHQETARFISSLFHKYVNDIDQSEKCFAAFHYLSYNIGQVLCSIKDVEGKIACCKDIKRHEFNALSANMIHYSTFVAQTNTVSSKFMRNLQYHIKNNIEISHKFKCKSKDREVQNSYNRLYNFLLIFVRLKSLVSKVPSDLFELCQKMLEMWSEIKDNDREPYPLIVNIFEAPENSDVAFFSVRILSSVIKCRKESLNGEDSSKELKNLIRFMWKHREARKCLGFSSSVEFIHSKTFKDIKDMIPVVDFIHLEICALSRFGPGEVQDSAKLFEELIDRTDDVMLVAQSCRAVNDSMIKNTKIEVIEKAIKILESAASEKFNVEVSLALALANYSIYSFKSDIINKAIKAEEALDKLYKLDIQKEIELLKYLEESLHHFTNVIHHLVTNKEDVAKIFSLKIISTILWNIGGHYHNRGIKHKDLETFILLWNFSQIEDLKLSTMLNIGIFFLDFCDVLVDGSGNYLRFSKKFKTMTIDEITLKLDKMIEDESQLKLGEQKDATKYFILSYLLSLWVYKVCHGKKIEGFQKFQQFKELWLSVRNLQLDTSNNDLILSKLHLSVAEINLTCFNRFCPNFISAANANIMKIKEIDPHFVIQFYQIFWRTTTRIINYSNNRLVDMNHFETTMGSLILHATKKSFCFRLLDFLSLSILRYLNMEKIDKAKTQLRDITSLVGLKEEILIETPTKVENPISAFSYESHEEIRKVAVVSKDHMEHELSMIYQDQTSLLSRQLESFVHKLSCDCEICNIPQLKFVTFQIGCHYSRLLWLMGKFKISVDFNSFAFKTWREVCDVVRRSRNDKQTLMIDKTSFNMFSINWLLQYADGMIRIKELNGVEEIYNEVELLCTPDIPDYECFKETLYCRKENLNFLIENNITKQQKSEEKATTLSFNEFLKIRSKEKPKKSPRNNSKAKNDVSNVIYVDSSGDEDKKPTTFKNPNTRSRTAKKKTTKTVL
ncbi:CLUMA_CG008454, isoform A [Clunio marinus]|uniref:CLUMA_CG008454, isoform A n=1 Tax=Clunio marinus TaxID=568069 RepID=A0A1J1I7N2_9DIPT|nr:CLUMA_CG008454, isoform A [Clunio marinus]